MNYCQVILSALAKGHVKDKILIFILCVCFPVYTFKGMHLRVFASTAFASFLSHW